MKETAFDNCVFSQRPFVFGIFLLSAVITLGVCVHLAAGEGNPDEKKKQAEEAWQKEQVERSRQLEERQSGMESRQQAEERWAREEEIRQKEVAAREEELGKVLDIEKDQIKRIVERKRVVREREREFRTKIERLESEIREREENKKRRDQTSEKKKESLASKIEAVEDSLKKNPDDPELHWLLGIYNQDLGVTDEAIHHFSETIKLNPGHFGAYYSLALAYDQKKDGPQALLNMKKAEQLLLVKTRSWDKEQVKWAARSRKNLRRLHKKYSLDPGKINLDNWLSGFRRSFYGR